MAFRLYSGSNRWGRAELRGDDEGTFATLAEAKARAAEIGDDHFTIYEHDQLVATGLGRYERDETGTVVARRLVWTR